MKKLHLIRLYSDDQGTLATLIHSNKKVCNLHELPNRNNKANLSRIPAGSYLVKYLKRSASGKYKDVYHIQNVPNRSGILIHAGNWAGDRTQGFRSDSYGCLLPCTKFTNYKDQRMGAISRSALRKLHQATNRQNFLLEIH